MAGDELSNPLTIRLPKDILGDIETIAAQCDRTRSWIIVRALKLYLQQEGKDILEIAKAGEEVTRGETHDFDTVLQEARDIIQGKVA